MRTIFIDESGDLGTKGRYFVIAILIPDNSKRILNFFKRFGINNSIDEVKASQLSFDQKQELFNKLSSKKDYHISYIVINKFHIIHEKIFEEKNLLYSYLTSLILEKVLMDLKEDVTILLDSRSIKIGSKNTLIDYVKIKAYTQWSFKYNINFSLIDSKNSKIIQATDLVANAIYAKYNYNKKHFFNLLGNIDYFIEYPDNKIKY